MNFRMQRYRNRRRKGNGCVDSQYDSSANISNNPVQNCRTQTYPLNTASTNTEVEIVALLGCDNFTHRIAELGLGIGKKIRILISTGSGPMIVMLGNSRIALGQGMSEKILVR